MRYLIIFFILSIVLVTAIYTNMDPNFIESFNIIFSENEKKIESSDSNKKNESK